MIIYQFFRNKKALTAALNYYRANHKLFKQTNIGVIETPTLFIWGKKDLAVGAVSVAQSHQYMNGYYKFIELDAGHWLIQTKYDEIKAEVEGHLLRFKTT